MTKNDVIQLLVLIEKVYSKFIFRDETIQQWFEFCGQMEYEKVMAKLKNHIRKSPFPPAIAAIAVFPFEVNEFPETLQEWIRKGRERNERDHHHAKRSPLPNWLDEYAARKRV